MEKGGKLTHRGAIWSPCTLMIFPLHLRTQKRSFYPYDEFIG